MLQGAALGYGLTRLPSQPVVAPSLRGSLALSKQKEIACCVPACPGHAGSCSSVRSQSVGGNREAVVQMQHAALHSIGAATASLLLQSVASAVTCGKALRAVPQISEAQYVLIASQEAPEAAHRRGQPRHQRGRGTATLFATTSGTKRLTHVLNLCRTTSSVADGASFLS